MRDLNTGLTTDRHCRTKARWTIKSRIAYLKGAIERYADKPWVGEIRTELAALEAKLAKRTKAVKA
jgi:hypothetical protein